MIYVVMAVYNRIEATLECLESFKKQTFRDFQIIIIDDGSTDGTEKILREHYPEITILKGDGNLWWTKAMYNGAAYAMKQAQPKDFILSINNDVTFDADYLEQLIKTSEKYRRAVVGSLCRDEANKKNILDSGVKIAWQHYRYTQTPFDQNKEDTTDIDTVSGRGVLIPIEVFQKIGNYAKTLLPHYGADYEFGFRAKKNGFTLALSHRAVVYLKNDLTGFRPEKKILSYVQAWKKLTHRKSPANIFVQTTLVLLHCPGRMKKIYTTLYVIAANIFLFTKNITLYTCIRTKLLKTTS